MASTATSFMGIQFHGQLGRTSTAAKAMRLLVWVLAISVPSECLFGLAIGLAGASREFLKFVAIVPAAASPLLVIAVGLLVRATTIMGATVSPWSGRALVTIVIMHSLLQIAFCILGFLNVQEASVVLNIIGLFVYTTAPLLLLTYISTLARRFDQLKFAKLAISVGSLIALSRFLFAWGLEALQNIHFGDWAVGSFGFIIFDNAIGFLLGVAGLGVLWRFSRRFERWTVGKCIACGYDLRGSSGPNCPECGAPWLPHMQGDA